MQRHIDLGFGDQLLLNGLDERWKGLTLTVTAFQIGAGLHGGGGGVGHVRGVVVAGVDVGNGGAIAHDVAVEVPRIAEMVLQKHGVGASRRAVDGVVRAHDGLGVGFGDGGTEGGQVSIFQVVRRNLDIDAMAGGLGTAVHGVVFGRRNDAQVVGIVALHAGDEGYAHASGEERVFAVGFLPAAPARVTEDVDVGCPEREPKEHLMVVLAHDVVIFGAGLGRDGLAHAVHEIGVPGGRHADHLWEIGGVAGKGYAVQPFVPPVVLGNPEAGDGRGMVPHLLDFFFQGHAADQVVYALVGR